jgi:class 3 adenylate cyclase
VQGFRALLRELFTGLGGPPATVRRLRLVAWLRLLVAFPLVVVPAGIGFYTTTVEPHDYATTAAIRTGWTIAHAVTLGLNLLVLWASRPARPRPELARWLVYAMVVGDITANQIGSHAMGVIAGPASVFVILMVASYRAALDWRSGMVATVAASALFSVSAALEITATIPQQPLLERPSPLYDHLDNAVSMAFVVVAAIWVTFAALNYAFNQSYKLHRYITEAVLRRYLPAGLVERAGRGELRLDDAPERRVVTVVFTDLVGFTAVSERLGADTVGKVLTRYFSETAAIAHRHGAIVDKFIGDASMIVLGAPDTLDPAEQARRAVIIARELHTHVAGLGDLGMQARTGINTGEAVVGNFGSAERSDYTAVGPTVNLAARLEAAAAPGQIMVGAETARLLDGSVALASAGALELKGIGPVPAFRLE